ncbi:MAG: hypothetical protein ACRD1H_05560, partial [Vicinamibacterales bacterium]
LQRGDKCITGRGQLTIEHLDREDLGRRRFLAEDGGDGGSVSEAIDVVVVLETIRADPDATGHTLHVRMRGVHAAVDDRDAYATTGEGIEC